MESRRKPSWPIVAAWAAIVAAVVFRVATLGSDATYPIWTGWIVDEGRWTELAREWALFGRPDVDSSIARLHLVVGPLFQAVSAVWFELFGVSPASARLTGLVAGVGIVGLAGRILWRRLGAASAAGAMVLLAVHPDLVYFSRVAIPEMPALFLELMAFGLLVGGPRTTGRAAAAGIAMAVALGFKATTAPVVPVFALITWAVGRPDDAAGGLSRAGAFLLAVALPGVLAGVAYLGWAGGDAAVGGIAEVLEFFVVDSAYGVVGTLFSDGAAPRVNLLLIAVWLVAVLAVAVGALRGRRVQMDADGDVQALFVGAGIWIVGWLVPWAVLAYFPERYVIHIHVPLVLGAVSGIALLRGGAVGVGVAEIDAAGGGSDDALRGVGGWPRFAAASALALPLAVALTPALLSLVDVVGPRWTRLGIRGSASVVVAAAVGAWIARRRRAPVVVLRVLVAFPLAVAIVWAVARRWEVVGRFWAVEGLATALSWTLVYGLAALLTLATARMQGRGAGIAASKLVTGYLAALAVVWSAGWVDDLRPRSDVLSTVAAHLTQRYDSDLTLGVFRSSSLFLETPFRYREGFGVDDAPRVVVVLWSGEELDELARHEVVAEFPVDVGERFDRSLPAPRSIRIYERRTPTGLRDSRAVVPPASPEGGGGPVAAGDRWRRVVTTGSP